HRVVDDLAVLTAYVMAAADGPALHARHPDLLAHPAAGALHLVTDFRPGAVVRLARARVEAARAGQPAALDDHRPRAVVLLRFPFSVLHGDNFFRPNRLAAVRADQLLTGLGNGLIVRFRHAADVLLVDGPVRRPADWHLVLLVLRPHDRVGYAAHMLLIDRSV